MDGFVYLYEVTGEKGICDNDWRITFLDVVSKAPSCLSD